VLVSIRRGPAYDARRRRRGGRAAAPAGRARRPSVLSRWGCQWPAARPAARPLASPATLRPGTMARRQRGRPYCTHTALRVPQPPRPPSSQTEAAAAAAPPPHSPQQTPRPTRMPFSISADSHIKTYRQIHRRTYAHRERHTDSQTGTHRDRQVHRHANAQTQRQVTVFVPRRDLGRPLPPPPSRPLLLWLAAARDARAVRARESARLFPCNLLVLTSLSSTDTHPITDTHAIVPSFFSFSTSVCLTSCPLCVCAHDGAWKCATILRVYLPVAAEP
jgi:hypothetical protein